MAEMESAHGKLSTVDKTWTGPRFIALLAGTLVAALIVIYVISSIGEGADFKWSPLAHDPIKHVFETGSI